MVSVRRALLSCYDKTGLDGFAKALAGLGIELVASGGTAEALRQQGLRVVTVEEFAGMTEQLDGRVKTLHPNIHAGILARRDDPGHLQRVGPGGLIDLVAVNLYPFAGTVGRPGASLAEALEQIDIGGAALLRAGAKNFTSVAVLCEPRQYPDVADALLRGHGQLPESMTRGLAARAFDVTSAYDRQIFEYLASACHDPAPGTGRGPGDDAAGAGMPGAASVALRRQQALRYGENPHQRGAWYVPEAGGRWGLGTLRQLQGKALSYNNLLDVDAALRGLLDFTEPACVIIKHHAPCGFASAEDVGRAFVRAVEGDPESAFGGVVGLNRPLDAATAERMAPMFFEVVLAPAVDPQAEALLRRKSKLRVLTVAWPVPPVPGPEWRQLLGGWLLQDPDAQVLDEQALRVVTTRRPSERERADLLFAWRAAKHVTSNGVVLASGQATVGIGQGQPSRVGAVRLALQQAGARSRDAVAASDGFFPFPDSMELLAQAGVTAVIQPGGSIRDAALVEAANRHRLAMLMTGIRHFRH